MIQINNLNKYYTSGNQKFHALKDINLTFPDKGFFFITGKSGSGKSTLLNIIGGIDKYDDGELIIDDLNTKKFTKKDFNAYRNSYIGFIFQEFNVIKNLTVYENVALSLQLQNKSLKENKQLILETIEKVGLGGKEKRKMNQLSGGERQRVAVARALVKNPHVLIADEPTGNLDQNNRDVVMDILKQISKEKLVIIVTHDKTLSSRYGDYEITLKDGAIVKYSKQTSNEIEDNTHSYLKEASKPVQPTILTSIFLSCKSLKQNLTRFIIITLFFAISLVFAATAINLYFSETTSEYANFQNQHNNNYISISQKETLFGQTVKTGFFEIDVNKYVNLIKEHSKEDYQVYHSIPVSQNISLQVDGNHVELKDFRDEELFAKRIENIIVYDDIKVLRDNYSIEDVNTKIYEAGVLVPVNLTCFITDYLAQSLIERTYFDDYYDNSYSYAEYFEGKYLTIDGCKEKIYIAGIIKTDYQTFAKKVSNDYEYYNLSDPNYQASFYDNLGFYSSIFMSLNNYVGDENENQFISTSSIDYVSDDFIYLSFDSVDVIKNIKLTTDNPELQLLKGTHPKKADEGEMEQILISKKFFDSYIKLSLEEAFPDDGTLRDPKYLDEKGNPIEAVFSFYGYRRITSSFGAKVVGIVDNTDEEIIYFCNETENDMFYNYLKTSFADYDNGNFGGNLLIDLSNNPQQNTKLYEDLLNNKITIDNISFVKLQVVNEFIDNNLIIFLGLFFALCLFSILMIFNFVVITIKNSQKDIGIFMSLGMNGTKISFIYLFQIIIVSTLSFVISLIGAFIFLKVLDNSLSADASKLIAEQFLINIKPIDFSIFKVKGLGVLITLGIAFVAPIITLMIPLTALSRKKPIDVIKIS